MRRCYCITSAPATGTLKSAADAAGTEEDLRLLIGEWVEVVDAWELPDWPAYREARRGSANAAPLLGHPSTESWAC